MKKLLLMLVIFCSSCYSLITDDNIKDAENVCENHAGIRSIGMTVGEDHFDVKCNDGFTYTCKIKQTK